MTAAGNSAIKMRMFWSSCVRPAVLIVQGSNLRKYSQATLRQLFLPRWYHFGLMCWHQQLNPSALTKSIMVCQRRAVLAATISVLRQQQQARSLPYYIQLSFTSTPFFFFHSTRLTAHLYLNHQYLISSYHKISQPATSHPVHPRPWIFTVIDRNGSAHHRRLASSSAVEATPRSPRL